MFIFIENGNVGAHLGLCFHLAQCKESGLWSQAHLDLNPCSTSYSLWLSANQLFSLCTSFLVCKIRIILSALQVVIRVRYYWFFYSTNIYRMPTMCRALFEESIWNIRINPSMAIKWDRFEGRTPIVFFCDTKTVITVWKLKDNCKCSVFIFPEAHKALRSKLFFSLSLLYSVGQDKNMAFTNMNEYLSEILSNLLLNEKTNMRVKLIPRAFEERGCI